MGCGRAIYIPSILRTTVTNSLKKKSSEPHLHKANMYAQLRSAKPSKDLVPKAPLPPPLKWKRFEAEWSRFVEFATDPTNEQRPRDWTTWHADSNSNLSNTYSALKINLERIARERSIQAPSMRDLLDMEHFESNFKDYCLHLESTRGNAATTIAQNLRNHKRAVYWASTQLRTKLKKGQHDALISALENLCARREELARPQRVARREAKNSERSLIDMYAIHQTVKQRSEDVLHDFNLESIDDHMKLNVIELTMLQLASRGPRGCDLHSMLYAENKTEADALVDNNSIPSGGSVLFRRGGAHRFEIVVPSIKGHFTQVATNCDAMLTVFLQLTKLGTGDHLFTTNQHGYNFASKHHSPHFSSSTFSAYFKSLTKKHLGVALTPRDYRGIRATRAVADYSEDGIASTALAMSTSAKRIYDTYNHGTLEGTWLSTQIQLYEDDRRVTLEEQTFVVPVIFPDAYVPEAVAARIIRVEGSHSLLVALFASIDDWDEVELSSNLTRIRSYSPLIAAKLTIDITTGHAPKIVRLLLHLHDIVCMEQVIKFGDNGSTFRNKQSRKSVQSTLC